jgi:DNA polymerase-3 subunit beta
MKFIVGREALGDAVAFVSRALPSRPVVPVLSGLLLEAAADGLTLSCFDYEVSARVRVDADVAEPGSALVPGRLLAEITRSLPAGPAEFSGDADMVNLTCGRAEFGLVCLPAQDYPALPEAPGPVGVVDGGVLAMAVAQVAAAASRDDTLPMLTAICLDISGDVLTLAATDRYRLAAREVSFTPAEPDLREIALIPARFMVEAARAFVPGVPVTMAFGSEAGQGDPARTAAPGGAPDQPRPAEGLACFESGDRRLTGRLIAGEFIRYRNRFGGEFGCQADLPAGPLIEAVRRAALVAERAGPVRLSFRPDQVVIEAHAEGRARAAETVTADFAGDEPVISFNPHFLLDGLAAAAAGQSAWAGEAAGDGDQAGADAGAGRIRIRFNSPAKPALITWVPAAGAEEPGGVPAFRYLLVPLRVPERS